MTLTSLVLGIGVAAVLLTALMGLALHRVKSWPISLLQNFCGALFIFSGAVKAIDPLGTAYKMEQYFAEFETTFAGTSFSFLSPLFPRLAESSATVALAMIVFEIALGAMLLIGTARRFTAWAFFLLVAFFTVLTGFTYLTGYVPQGVNFFQFGQWTAYEVTNMKVTDCGCFGDFLKLEPFVSFMKDVFLLIPAIAFVARPALMHNLFTVPVRWAITGVVIVASTVYGLSNYVWNLPDVDFRPFKKGVNIAERKQLEEEAEANVELIAYSMTNKTTGEKVELPVQEYLAQFKNFPETEWELEQVKTEPAIPRTKISDFDVSDLEGNSVTEQLLSDSGYSFMIVAYQLKTEDGGWEEEYVQKWQEYIRPLAEQAKEAGHKIYTVTAFNDGAVIEDFKRTAGVDIPFYMADDILLKTIIRSNPGIVLLSSGTILDKWHYRQLPEFKHIQSNYRLAGTE